GVELHAVGSRARESAASFASEFDVPRSHASYVALADDPDVDVVCVATPHSLHRDNSLLCLDAGKGVICEKPFALNAREAADAIARARERRLFLMEAMWTRYVPAVVALRELLADDVIGNVQLMIGGGAFMPAYDPDFYLFDRRLGGGVLLDAGVYLVSMASMVFGSPTKISAAGSIGATGVDEHDAILLEHANGAIATLYISLRAKASPELTLLGDRGSIRIHAPIFAPRQLTISIDGKADETREFPFAGNGYQFEAIEAARCIRAGLTESDVMPLDETLSIMQTMDEVRRHIGMTYPQET
ncbi:MAG: Gfo/Idh/MocA family protein, partial [Gammaproteobacteria bacterium]